MTGGLTAVLVRGDIIAIWNQALPEDELNRLVEAGRPGLLWGEETPNAN